MGESLVYKCFAPVLLTDTDENSGMLALTMQSRSYLPYLAQITSYRICCNI